MAALMRGSAFMGIRLDAVAIDRLLQSEEGPVMMNMAVRATRLQDAAKRQCGYSAVPRPDSHLRDTIVKRFVRDGTGAGILVGSPHPRARLHHDGSRPHEIVPVNAKVLAFPVGGGMVFTTHVNHPGTAPNRYLTDNLGAAR